MTPAETKECKAGAVIPMQVVNAEETSSEEASPKATEDNEEEEGEVDPPGSALDDIEVEEADFARRDVKRGP